MRRGFPLVILWIKRATSNGVYYTFGGGGGGGSFLDPAALNPLLVGGFRSGNGLVEIEQLSSGGAVPEPGSLALLAAGGAAGFASRRRKRRG